MNTKSVGASILLAGLLAGCGSTLPRVTSHEATSELLATVCGEPISPSRPVKILMSEEQGWFHGIFSCTQPSPPRTLAEEVTVQFVDNRPTKKPLAVLLFDNREANGEVPPSRLIKMSAGVAGARKVKLVREDPFTPGIAYTGYVYR